MNTLAHFKKIVRFIECDGIPLFPDEHREKVSQTEDFQLRINRALGIDEKTFLKYFKAEPSASDISETQRKINKALGISPELFKKWNH